MLNKNLTRCLKSLKFLRGSKNLNLIFNNRLCFSDNKFPKGKKNIL